MILYTCWSHICDEDDDGGDGEDGDEMKSLVEVDASSFLKLLGEQDDIKILLSLVALSYNQDIEKEVELSLFFSRTYTI